MPERFDVLIAGAGIAGCHAARDLAGMGHSVALIDRRSREHLGHDWWDSVHAEVFDEVGIPQPQKPELMESTDLYIVSPPLETLNLEVPDVTGKKNIDRLLFAKRQLKYAEEAGAVFFDKTAVIGPIPEDGCVAGAIVKTADGSKTEFKAEITIDATGMSASIRRKMPETYGFSRFMDRADIFVTHREIYGDNSGNTSSRLVFGKHNGVQWINRSQPGLVDFFAGAIDFPGRPSPRKLVGELIGSQSNVGRRLVRGGYGAPIPVRRCFDSFVAPGLVICGDAACQCNPIDGSGIGSSLRAAGFAARTIHSALENGRIDVEVLWPYVAAYKRTQGMPFAQLNIIQKFMVSEPKLHLELLFRRGIIHPRDFWGSGSAKKSDSKIEQLIKLLKLADRPRFIARLVRAMTAAEQIAEHYANFPERYNPLTFNDWRARTTEFFSRIPPPFDLR